MLAAVGEYKGGIKSGKKFCDYYNNQSAYIHNFKIFIDYHFQDKYCNKIKKRRKQLALELRANVFKT